MRKCKYFATAFLVICGVVWAGETENAGKVVLNKFAGCVVSVQMVAENKVVVEGKEVNKQEAKYDLRGTVITPDGLTVCSLMASNPAEIYNDMAQGESGGAKFSLENKPVDIKIRLAGGDELPAELVLRDKDQDIIFVRPVTPPSKPFAWVNLNDSAEPEIMQEVYLIGRLGRIGNWSPFVVAGRIISVVKKPRLYFVPVTSFMEYGLGNPVFAAPGRAVGILLLRKLPQKITGLDLLAAEMGGMEALGMLPIILPAREIIQLQAQVPARSK